MNDFRPFTPEQAVSAASGALSRTTGGTAAIEDMRILSDDDRRNLLIRALWTNPDGICRPIIIKVTRAAGYDPFSAEAFETFGLVREWAAATLLTRQPSTRGHGAALLAADLARGVLVFSDIGEGLPSLVEPLLKGSAENAEAALVAYAKAMGRLHADTVGWGADHADLVRKFLPSARMPLPGRGSIDRSISHISKFLGGTLPDVDVALVAERLGPASPWRVLAHRDPCPDNVLLTPDGAARLIDFEFSSPGHALSDAAYWRIGFPTCWCAGSIPRPIGERIDAVYRAVVADGIPAAADNDAFRFESIIVGVDWLLGSLAWLIEPALDDDATWGIASRRARILHYLDVTIGDLSESGLLPGIRRTATMWLEQLRARWPGSRPLAPYPAFTRRRDEASIGPP